jgi:hypothetical protein
MLGGAMVITMAGEALLHLGTAEQCAAEEISICPATKRILDRRHDHAPENEYDAFGGENSGWIASGQVNSMAPSSSANPWRFIPAGELAFGKLR